VAPSYSLFEGRPDQAEWIKSNEPGEKLIFFKLIKNAPAFAPQGGATRRQADAS